MSMDTGEIHTAIFGRFILENCSYSRK